jgi:hypothetical protein
LLDILTLPEYVTLREEILKIFPRLNIPKVIGFIFQKYKILLNESGLMARTLYHGTSAFYLPYIVRNGFKGKYPNDFVRENLFILMYYFFVFAIMNFGNEEKNFWPDTGIHKVFPNLNKSILESCNSYFLRYITLFYDRQFNNREEKFFTSKLLNAYSFSYGEIGEGPFQLLQIPVLFEKELLTFWSIELRKKLTYPDVNIPLAHTL